MGKQLWSKEDRDLMVECLGVSTNVDDACNVFSAQSGRPINRNQMAGTLRLDGIVAAQRLGRDIVIGPQTAAPEICVEPARWTEPAEYLIATEGKDAEVERRVTVPDVHVPAHDRQAYAVLLGVIRDFQPHKGHLIGDFLEMESLSSHPKKGADRAHLAAEYRAGNEALDQLQDASNTTSWVMMEGNHEVRTSRFSNEAQDGALTGMLDVPANLYIQAPSDYHRAAATPLRGIEWVPLSKQTLVDGPIGYLHGVFEGQNHCRDHASVEAPRRGVKHIVYGHMHTLAYAKAKSGFDAWCCGFLGDERRAEFSYTKGRATGWTQGFLLHEIYGDTVQTTPVTIKDGKAIFGGRVYGEA
jgi:predicted phosphodiesterase